MRAYRLGQFQREAETDVKPMPSKFINLLKQQAVIFWDFDGVVKDSLDIKSLAFENLFLPFGPEIASRVRIHHERNGGVSRFEKIPLYLKWAGQPTSPLQVNEFCNRFAKSVQQGVLDAPWVPGVREYLLGKCTEQYFILVTATPQEEIEQILDALDISHCFREVYGAPTNKAIAIAAVLDQQKCPPIRSLMIGDAETDRQAALFNSVPFLLRRTPLNLAVQNSYSGPMFDDLNDE